jgi:hypothetical protein
MPHDGAPSPPPPETPPPPGPRTRRWWVRARRKDSRRTPDRPCLNCGDPTVGYYCPTCGQKKVDVRVSLRRMLGETLEDELYLNVLLPRTLGALFFRPGHLTREYVQGRIVRYIQPFRLYLVSSILFFVLLPWLANLGGLEEQIEEGMTRADSIVAAEVDTVARATVDTAGAGPLLRGVRPQVTLGESNVNLNLGIEDTARVPRLLRPLNRRLLQSEERLDRMTPREAFRTVRVAFMENAPTGIFLMMPLFAAILKVLYVRRKRFYVEHFVFALHVHAFTFLIFLLMLLLPGAIPNLVLGAWLTLYVLIAMKRVYGQGIVKTVLKYLLLGWAYSMLLVVGVVVTFLLTAFSL